MSRTATALLVSWVAGAAASAWLIHGDLPLSSVIGFILTFGVIEVGTMLEHPDDMKYSPLDRIGSPLSAGTERAIGLALIVISVFAAWLVSPDGLGLAPPSLASPAAFIVCGIPAGAGLFLLANAHRKRTLKAQEGPSTGEVAA